MVYWEYNLGITERNMEIKEYTEFKADEILQLYTQVGWTAYTEDMPALECGYKNSLLVSFFSIFTPKCPFSISEATSISRWTGVVTFLYRK